MTKRPRPEEAVVELYYESAHMEDESNTQEVHEPVESGPPNSLGSTNKAIGGGPVSGPVPSVIADPHRRKY